MVQVMEDVMTARRWKETHGNKTFQEAARELRAAGYVRRMRAGQAVWLPIGHLKVCANKTQMRITDAELTERVKTIVSVNGGIATVPQVVKALGKTWNASIQRRVTAAFEAIGLVRMDGVSKGIWGARNEQ